MRVRLVVFVSQQFDDLVIVELVESQNGESPVRRHVLHGLAVDVSEPVRLAARDPEARSTKPGQAADDRIERGEPVRCARAPLIEAIDVERLVLQLGVVEQVRREELASP